MKIYQYVKEDNKRIIKLLGIPLMVQNTDYMAKERVQSFLGGLISTVKVDNTDVDCSSSKAIKFLGLPILSRVEKDNLQDYYLFNKKFYTASLFDEFKRKYFKYFDKKHDDIYILRANSGEIYLTLTYILKTLIKRNQSKNPLLVVSKKYHVDMIKMICPEIPYVYIKHLYIVINEDNFKIDDFNFHLFFSHKHFKQAESDIKLQGQNHYFTSILDRFNIDSEAIEMNRIQVPQEIEQSMLGKIGSTKLNLDKFVFIAPEALSCKPIDEDFWVLLMNKLQAKGYDIFLNLTSDSMKFIGADGFKTCNLSFGEAFALAQRAKKIVSLRSGFTEFLLQTNVPIDVLYTKFCHRHFLEDMDIYQVVSGFGLTKLPYIEKSLLREFNMYEVSPKYCIEEIVEDL